MTKCQSSVRSEDGKPQIKYKGIHEPKGRVKGFRVEIRPPNSAQKIWVGTFDTRSKAMLAFDAAVYLTGKDPYYFVYPENYFPPRSIKPSREAVQMEAKKFADKTDDLPVNPASFLVDSSKAGAVEAPLGLTPGAGSERTTLTTQYVKAVKKMDTPVLPDCSKQFEGLDKFLQDLDYVDVPPFIPANSDRSIWDLTWEEVKEAKADVKEAKFDMEESAAFVRGYNAPNSDILTVLFDRPPPENFLPCIEDEFFPVFYSPSKPSKRKRDATEGAGIITEDRKSVGLCATDVDDWLHDFFLNEPMKQRFDLFGPNEPSLWSFEDQ